ncbi:MAG: hypothetical protein H6810_12810 [Phycisphaeraceae bacterium]|nr:MAG: hypothetical protein H6810_12810 [Phycisphaeraceae bacterium]
MPRLAVLTLLVFALSGCGRMHHEYGSATPAETLDSAHQMIVNGEADRLVDLVYAEDEQTRSFLNQVGLLLGSVQKLADAVEQRFPEELAKFRADAAKAAEEGDQSPFFARLVAASRPRGNQDFGVSQINRQGLTVDTGVTPPAARSGLFRGPRTESERRFFNNILKQLLADPYRWLAEGRDKLGTTYVTDDTVALTWDDRPVLPPFGLVLVLRGDRWQLVPPTSYPGVKQVMPRNEDEWLVWGSIVKTLDHVVDDLTKDVKSGKVLNMTDLADTAVEKAAIPVMLVVYAYTNLLDERKKEAEAARTQAKAAEGEAPSTETPAKP